MSERYDVIVVGVGTMGSAACMALAARGVRVLGLEQFDVPHTFGAHHGHSRLFRTAYYEHPDYVPLLQRSLTLWRTLERDAGTELLHLTGGLYVGPDRPNGRGGGELVPKSIEAARRFGLEHTPLDHWDLTCQYWRLEVPDDYIGVFERDAGFLIPERAVQAMADHAIAEGAEIRSRQPLSHWHADQRGVEVHTEQEVYRADSLILAGGPWSARLCGDLGVPITVTRQVMGWVEPRKGAFEMGRWPCWAIEHEDGGLLYGTPVLPWHPGFKAALHKKGSPCDPASVNRAPEPGDEDTFREGLRRFIPEAHGPVLSMAVCMYDNSPDGHFILDRHPLHANVIVATGFSGHGFKFAPVIGEALADLAVHGTSPLPIGFLGLGRFRS